MGKNIVNFLSEVVVEMKEKDINRAYIGKRMKKFVHNEEKEVGLVVISDKERYGDDFYMFYVTNFEECEKIRDVEKDFEEYSKMLESELLLLQLNFPIRA